MRHSPVRRSLVGLLGVMALTGCPSKKETPPPAPAPPSTSSHPLEDASPPAEPEKPLAWATRPAAKGAFYPIVDGTCVHGEIWPTAERALFTYGNATGVYTKGARVTIARLDDEGLVVEPKLAKAVDPKLQDVFSRVSPVDVRSAGPSLVLYSNDRGAGRTRVVQSLWKLEEAGWAPLVISDDHTGPNGEEDQPHISPPVVFKNWLVAAYARPSYGRNADTWKDGAIKSWPLEKDAPPVPGLAGLGKPTFIAERLAATASSLYAFGYEIDGILSLARVLVDGKVVDVPLDEQDRDAKLVAHGNALYDVAPTAVWRWEGAKRTKLALTLGAGVTITGADVAPNGDLWLVTSKNVVMTIHEGSVAETPLPAPAKPKPKEAVQHWPASGSTLAGVALDDPWAIGAAGSLFHFESGKWTEVELPAPPFATIGQYQAQAIAMKAKGDPWVNAGYAEKGLGWKTPERYRAVLRKKRPKEVLRCHESAGAMSGDQGSGSGFSASPPIADESCQTPFVVLLRLGTREAPNWKFERQAGFTGLRKVIQDTPSLGAQVDIVELEWLGQMVAGVRGPTMTVAAARELALATAKRISGDWLETRPEVVCGVPPAIEKTIKVDVATGKVASPDAN